MAFPDHSLIEYSGLRATRKGMQPVPWPLLSPDSDPGASAFTLPASPLAAPSLAPPALPVSPSQSPITLQSLGDRWAALFGRRLWRSGPPEGKHRAGASVHKVAPAEAFPPSRSRSRSRKKKKKKKSSRQRVAEARVAPLAFTNIAAADAADSSGVTASAEAAPPPEHESVITPAIALLQEEGEAPGHRAWSPRSSAILRARGVSPTSPLPRPRRKLPPPQLSIDTYTEEVGTLLLSPAGGGGGGRERRPQQPFGRGNLQKDDGCMCVSAWRLWLSVRAANAEKKRMLSGMLRDGLFANAHAASVANLCGLTRVQLTKLAEVFADDLRLSRSGCVTARSFLEWCGLSQSEFNVAFFSSLCKMMTLSGSLSSLEDFLVAIVSLCMFSKLDLLKFFFSSIDADSSGALSESEYLVLMGMLGSSDSHSFPGSFSKILIAVDANKDGMLQFDEFVLATQRFPLSMFPLFKFQIQVQDATFGLQAWTRLREFVDARGVADRVITLHPSPGSH